MNEMRDYDNRYYDDNMHGNMDYRENYRNDMDYRDYDYRRDYDRRGGKINNRDYRNYRDYRGGDYYEESRNLQEQRGIKDIDPIEFFVVMNSAYNDYKDIFSEDIEGYIRFTIDFIKDEDAKEGKIFKYFTQIVK